MHSAMPGHVQRLVHKGFRNSLGSLSSLTFGTKCAAKGLSKASAVFDGGAGSCTFTADSTNKDSTEAKPTFDGGSGG